jgi:hypothetical protein
MRCLYYQWKISKALDGDDPIAELPIKHMAKCPSCRQFHARSAALDYALRAAATAEAHSDEAAVPAVARMFAETNSPLRAEAAASDGDITSLRLYSDRSAKKRASRRRLAWAATALTAAVCAAIALLSQQPRPSDLPNDEKPLAELTLHNNAAKNGSIEKTKIENPNTVTDAAAERQAALLDSNNFLADLERPVQSIASLARKTVDRQLSRATSGLQSTGQAILPKLPVFQTTRTDNSPRPPRNEEG